MEKGRRSSRRSFVVRASSVLQMKLDGVRIGRGGGGRGGRGGTWNGFLLQSEKRSPDVTVPPPSYQMLKTHSYISAAFSTMNQSHPPHTHPPPSTDVTFLDLHSNYIFWLGGCEGGGLGGNNKKLGSGLLFPSRAKKVYIAIPQCTEKHFIIVGFPPPPSHPEGRFWNAVNSKNDQSAATGVGLSNFTKSPLFRGNSDTMRWGRKRRGGRGGGVRGGRGV